jgi:hypothetical protein
MNEKPPGKSKTKDSMLCRFCAYCTETSDQGGKGLNPASFRAHHALGLLTENHHPWISRLEASENKSSDSTVFWAR